MKVILAVFCIHVILTGLKCEEGKIINARIDTEPLTNGLMLYNIGKFRKFKKAHEMDLSPKKPNNLSSYTAFASDALTGSPPERRPRVKKVLPFYDDLLPRVKRSIMKDIEEKEENKMRERYKKHLRKKNKQENEDGLIYLPTVSSGDLDESSLTNHKPVKKQTRPRLNPKRAKRNKSFIWKRINLGKEKHTESQEEIIKKKIREVKLLESEDRKERIRKRKKKSNKTYLRHTVGNSRRLIAARDAFIEEYPYVVSIQKRNVHWCSGAILNQKVVITTANCLWRSNRVSRMTVRAGSRYTERGGQVAHIAEVKTHPDWNIRSLPDNDVGMILLDRDIRFSDSVHSVDLPNRYLMPAYEDAWVTSFGTDRRDGHFTGPSRTLQVYHAKVLPRDECSNVTARYGVQVSENFLCIAQAGYRAPCTRDTGAPAVSDGIVYGVASWGIRKLCGTERFPAMFSYLGSKSNVKFIQDTLMDFMSEERINPFPDRLETTAANATTTTEAPIITTTTARTTTTREYYVMKSTFQRF